MKEKILIDASGGKSWIGGLYHKCNLIFSLLCNESICRKYRICLITESDNVCFFRHNFKEIKIYTMNEKVYRIRKIKLLMLCIKENVKFLFPSGGKIFLKFGITPIRWIPDFQHNYYPENFSRRDITIRNHDYARLENSRIPLILSSNNCLEDYRKYYSSKKREVYVVPFVSYIKPIIEKIDKDQELLIMNKYKLCDAKYACIMNQFWKHKNHIVVFEAIKRYFEDNPDSDFRFVFTGEISDYRNLNYIEKLKKKINNEKIKSRINLLGFIDRYEQIVLMKNAEYIIQPSLFEGWGTVVEDAKVLDKTILLSDIPIHREQKNDKCILFDPYDANELTELIEQENVIEHISDIKFGIKNMYERAKEYSKGFEQLLKDCDNEMGNT